MFFLFITLLIQYSLAKQCWESRECMYETINTTSKVECYGFDACERSTITTTGDLYCYGYEGCSQAKYLNGDTVKCNGVQGCIFADEIKASTQIACDGYLGCLLAGDLSAPEIRCNGAASCQSAGNVAATTYLYAEGNAALYKVGSITVDPGVLVCAGAGSCAYAPIKSGTISAFGIVSLHNAFVDTTDLESLTFASLGHLSSYNASIYCRSGTQCDITCQGTGCYELYVYYEGRLSELSFSPAVCKKPANRGEQVNDKLWATWCPYIVGAAEMTLDEFIRMKHERMSTMIENDPEKKEIARVVKKMVDEFDRFEADIEDAPVLDQNVNNEHENAVVAISNRLTHLSTPVYDIRGVWINIAGAVGLLCVFILFGCCYWHRTQSAHKEYEVIV